MFSMKCSNCVFVCELVHFIKCVNFFPLSSMETFKVKGDNFQIKDSTTEKQTETKLLLYKP